MASIKLSYFNARGLAEPTRWILSHAGVEFEDIRAPLDIVPTPLPVEIKEKCRWGQVPLAEFDEGKKLCQSLAIARYFARKYNLVPEDLYEAALCDEYVDSIREFMSAWFTVTLEKEPDKKQEKKNEVMKSTSDRFLKVFESIIQANDGKHLVGKSLTWADIYVTHAVNHIELSQEVELLTDFPGLKSLCENTVTESAGIKAWLEKRPQSRF